MNYENARFTSTILSPIQAFITGATLLPIGKGLALSTNHLTFTIMKYLTDKEIAENRDKFVPAPLDEKNLTTDWITEELPDYGTTAGVRCEKSRTEAVMWINGDLIRVCYHDNKISFYALETFMNIDYIEKLIDDVFCDTEYLVCIKFVGNCNEHLKFSFFWECD